MKGLLATLPCLFADDTSTLLSVRSQLSTESSVESFMKVVEGRNVTEMASLMQNMVESQLFGDGVTETSGDVNLDSDIKQALKSIKELLLGDIQRALNREHSIDQQSLDDLHKCWDTCNTAQHDDQQQVDEFWRIMQLSKTQHEVCREDVHAKYINKITKCNALDIWIDGLQCPVCYKEECVTIHDPSNHKVGDVLQAHISWAKNAYAEWTLKHGACAQAVRDYDKADKNCDKIQGDFESSVCAHRQSTWTTCDVNQMTCCARCSHQFDLEVSRVECAEHDRKIDWSATKKIECYIDVLMASPTDDELAAKCKKDGKACINQWRENKYKECSDVCTDIDFDAGDYNVVQGINTTHRLNAHQSGDRCTLHLDINFPSMHPCVTCPPPPAGPCEESWIISTYAEYDVTTCVPGLEDEKECHPDQHQRWWAYSRAECRPCAPLIGRPGNGVPTLPGAAAHAGQYDVVYNGGKRSVGAHFHCDGRIEQPGIFSEMPYTSNVAQKCSQPRDSKATMYVMNTHGAGKYECLWEEGDNIVGSHYTGPNAFWGTIEYRLVAPHHCAVAEEWTTLYANGGSFKGTKLDSPGFNAAFLQGYRTAHVSIVRRKCEDCPAELKEVFLRRKTNIENYDAYEDLLVAWRGDVGFHTDFDIYSNLQDAIEDKNAFQFCNGSTGPNAVGFPRDCGPVHYIPYTWTTLDPTLHGGRSRQIYEYAVYNGDTDIVVVQR